MAKNESKKSFGLWFLGMLACHGVLRCILPPAKGDPSSWLRHYCLVGVCFGDTVVDVGSEVT